MKVIIQPHIFKKIKTLIDSTGLSSDKNSRVNFIINDHSIEVYVLTHSKYYKLNIMECIETEGFNDNNKVMAFSIPLKLFKAIGDNLILDQSISLEYLIKKENCIVRLKNKNAVFNIIANTEEKPPKIKEADLNISFSVKSSRLMDMIAYCADVEKSKITGALASIFFNVINNKLIIYYSDGNKLIKESCLVEADTSMAFVLDKSVVNVIKCITSLTDEILISRDAYYTYFEFADGLISILNINLKPPDFEKLIEKSKKQQTAYINVPEIEFKNAIKAALVNRDEKQSIIKFELNDNNLKIKSSGTGQDKANKFETVIFVDNPSNANKVIAIDGYKLQTILSPDNNKINIGLNDAFEPIVVTNDNLGHLGLLMPIQLKEAE